MGGNLDAVRLKLHRAQEHLETLHAAIQAFHWRDAYDATAKVDTKTHELVVSMIVREGPPREWGPLFGDLVHNLRSALDHLAIALVLSNNPNANISKTAFPMFLEDPSRSDAPAADKDVWKRQLKGMTADQKAAIEALQPFNNPRTAGGLVDTLTLLRRLSNTDKHKGLIPLGGVAGGTVRVIPRQIDGWQLDASTADIAPVRFENGTVIARFGLTPLEPNPDMDMDVGAQVGIGITLEEGVPLGTDIDQVLRFLYTRVLDIVNDFETRFFV